MAVCNVCFRHCDIQEGGLGACRARTCVNGCITCSNYGLATSIALDPIEKKPFRRFHPGSMILSVGSYGCNLKCPFCQNHTISWPIESLSREVIASGKGKDPEILNKWVRQKTRYIGPEELVDIAVSLTGRGNIGLAFTYNEPLVGYEYVRDAARLSHERGMKNVMVTNGTASLPVLEEILPYIDAMNIDLKGFTERYYRDVLSGNLNMVLEFIRRAWTQCHVEITTLIVPGENDSEEEMRALSGWIAGLSQTGTESPKDSRDIPLHISRFFPRFHMTDRDATDVSWIYHLAEVARENLRYVYPGNC